jgi:capsular exopolysaccharide synthesis family protein
MPVGYKDLLNAKDTGGGRSAKDVLKQYLANLPVFILCLVLCIAAAVLYTQFVAPKYYVSTSILIKDENSNTKGGREEQSDLLNNAMTGYSNVNIENEMQRLRSRGLIERVITKGGFNIFYYSEGKFRRTAIYMQSPFRIVTQNIADSSLLDLRVSKLTNWGASISYDEGDGLKRIAVRWNTSFRAGGKQFKLVPSASFFNEKQVYAAVWKPVGKTLKDFLEDFSVSVSGMKTTIIDMSVLSENLDRGKDMLNAIAREFRQSNIDELNKLAQSTIQFIDDRLGMVSDELRGVEGNLENYQGRQQAYDLMQQSNQSLTNSDVSEKTLSDIKVQQKVVDMVRESLLNQGNQDRPIPSTLGITDPTLNDLVTRYNNLVLRKEREAPGLAEKSILLQDLVGQINDLKQTISTNLQTISRNLELRASHFEEQNNQYTQAMASLPRKERILQEIKRQQSIKEGLFLYLLQKREETAISMTSHPSNYEQIDPAAGDPEPVQPNTATIFKLAILLGLILPIGIIYLRSVMNDKVNNREDIMKKTVAPIIGEVSHISRLRSRVLPALGQNLIGEQFRLIRSNLGFLQKEKMKQVILITSTTSGEGKSFISLNLAAVLAKSGKRVALLELDLRKPQDKNLSVDQSKGITDYLSGRLPLTEIGQPLEQLPNLDIYPAGPYLSDPADLLLNERVASMFAQLKQKYDVIVINSAPAGLVSDALVLGEYADTVLYVVRQAFSKKKQLGFVDDLFRTGKLNNMCLVFNDVKTGVRYGYDGYGYSKGNAYYRAHLNGQRQSVWSKMKNTAGFN